MSSLLLHAALLAISSGAGNQTPGPTTFICRAEPLSRIVGELSTVTGLKIECATACGDDVMVINASEVPTQTLLNEIAKVDAAFLKPLAGGGFRFVPDTLARQREERSEASKRASALLAVIDKQYKETQETPKTSGGKPETRTVTVGSAGTQIGMPNNTPEGLAVINLLRGIDPSQLAIGPNDRVVFSTKPNSMQRPLGNDSDAVLTELIKKHNATMGANHGNTDEAIARSQLPDSLKGMIDRMTKPIAGYSKADLVIGSMPFIGTLQATLQLYDDAGKVVFTAPHTIDQGALAMIMSPPVANTKDTPIELSPASKAMMTIFGKARAAMGGGRMVIPKELEDFVSDVTKHDPLALLPSDELLALGKAKKQPLVAVVPDEAESALGSFFGGNPTVQSFEAELAQGKVMTETLSNGWIEVKPAFPETARSRRTDRTALAALLHAARAKGVASLDDIAAFAPYAPSPMEGGVCQLFLSLFVPGAVSQGMDGFSTWEMYRIYGQLGQDQRRGLLSGGRIPIQGLTIPSQQELTKLVFGPMPQLRVGASTDETPDMISQMMTMATGGNDYKDEPTEVLPNGVPMSGYLQMTSTNESFVSPTSASAEGYSVPQIMGADELAMLKYISTTPMFKQFAPQMPKYDKFRLGSRDVYTMTFHLTQTAYVQGTLKDAKLPADAQIVSANSLPGSFQSAIDKKMEALKKSPLGALGAMGAGAGAPPP